jgi:hypothetical protein
MLTSPLQQRLLSIHLGAERIDLGTHQAPAPVLGQRLFGLSRVRKLLAGLFLAAELVQRAGCVDVQ